MTDLDQVIAAAFASEGNQEKANKVYLTLLQANLFVPVKKQAAVDPEEPFVPLSASIEDKFFLLGFDTLDRLQNWAGDHFDEMNYVELAGRDFIKGINEQVYFVLNPGESFHKEFSPDEVKHLKKIILKIEQLKGSSN